MDWQEYKPFKSERDFDNQPEDHFNNPEDKCRSVKAGYVLY
jgi:hypothetical protein